MPKFKINITPKQYVSACTQSELRELIYLLKGKTLGKWDEERNILQKSAAKS